MASRSFVASLLSKMSGMYQTSPLGMLDAVGTPIQSVHNVAQTCPFMRMMATAPAANNSPTATNLINSFHKHKVDDALVEEFVEACPFGRSLAQAAAELKNSKPNI